MPSDLKLSVVWVLVWVLESEGGGVISEAISRGSLGQRCIGVWDMQWSWVKLVACSKLEEGQWFVQMFM